MEDQAVPTQKDETEMMTQILDMIAELSFEWQMMLLEQLNAENVAAEQEYMGTPSAQQDIVDTMSDLIA